MNHCPVFKRGTPANDVDRTVQPRNYRAILHESALGYVEDTSVSALLPPPSGYERRHQVGLTYFGLFAYCVGSKHWLVDANRVLFVSPDREFVDDHPVEGLGHAAVLINPSENLLDDLGVRRDAVTDSAFADGARPSTANLQLLTHRFLHSSRHFDPLYKDEWIVRALQEALSVKRVQNGSRTRVVDQAKEFLHAHGCDRLALDDVAKEIGVTPVYLTQEFTRSEGTPLYRYQLRLRLSRALLELPHCDDITGLALDLGFSSHSHFSAAFRAAFGITPSQYRDQPETLRRQRCPDDMCQSRSWPNTSARHSSIC